MFDRYRHKLAPYIGAGLVILTPLGWSALANVQQQERRDSERAQQEAYADDKSVRALVGDPTEQAVATEKRERERQQRERYDLSAQWTSAVAAIIQVLISLAALGGLIATVFYARRAWLAAKVSASHDNEALELTRTQLNEARANAIEERKRIENDAKTQEERFQAQLAQAVATAKAARDSADNTSFIGRNQSRAYVHVAAARIDYTSPTTLLSTDSFDPHLYLKLQNVGATPTKSVRYAVVGSIETFKKIWDGYQDVALGSDWETFNVAPGDIQEVRVYVRNLKDVIEGDYTPGRNALGSKYFTVRGRIIYKDVFDKEHYTDFGFSCLRATPGEKTEMEAMDTNFTRYDPYPPAPKQIGRPAAKGASDADETKE